MRAEPKPRPNLFVIGAMKSGTSSLHAYLGAHPRVFMSRRKEPGWFIDKFRKGQSEDWYLSLFAEARNQPYRGESSTHYTKLPRHPGAAERIAAFSPDARIIYIMRDPIKRSISHYWHRVYHHNETRNILTALKRKREYTDYSWYAMQLRPYYQVFGADRILPLVFEELVSNPKRVMRGVYQWLGIDPGFIPPNISREYNTGPGNFRKPRLHCLRSLVKWRRRSAPALLDPLLRLLLERQVQRSSQGYAAVADYLRPIQLAQASELEELLGREFPQWTTLYAQEDAVPNILSEDKSIIIPHDFNNRTVATP